jgi:hypothetical protein
VVESDDHKSEHQLDHLANPADYLSEHQLDHLAEHTAHDWHNGPVVTDLGRQLIEWPGHVAEPFGPEPGQHFEPDHGFLRLADADHGDAV